MLYSVSYCSVQLFKCCQSVNIEHINHQRQHNIKNDRLLMMSVVPMPLCCVMSLCVVLWTCGCGLWLWNSGLSRE